MPVLCLPTLNLTLYLIQTLSLTGGIFSRGQLTGYQYVLKKLLFKTILFLLVFILSHTVRFLLDLSLFTMKLIYMLKAF